MEVTRKGYEMNCTRRDFVRNIAGGALAIMAGGCLSSEAAGRTAKKPNILLIMADDMGFSDIGCYGGEISTPNIDALAGGGLRFRQFYNTGRCCPTRASLLTGLYSHHTGLGWMTASNLGYPGYTGNLNSHCVTIAQVLRGAGYRSYVCGKWHVVCDKNFNENSSKRNWPLQRGFDRYYGALSGGGNYFKPKPLLIDNEIVEAPDQDYFYSDAIGDYALKFLNEHFTDHADAPFFMYLPFYAPHRPLQARQKDIAKYRGKYLCGWDEIREQRYKRQLEMGLIDRNWQLSARSENVRAWDDVPENERNLWDKRMATYAAQVDNLDQNVGRVINGLKALGKLDNTVVIFLSDNGGCAEPAGKGVVSIIGTPKSMESYRKPWANASDTPFRRFKKQTFEGGISTPLIVSWSGLNTLPGGYSDVMGHVIDIMPTLAELAGAKYPDWYDGQKIYPCAGKSLVPAFSGGDVPREALYFEHEANRAVRCGDWKLVAGAAKKPPYEGKWELYNMREDRSETHELSKERPELVKKLSEMWDKWAKANDVYPLDGRSWSDKIKADVDR